MILESTVREIGVIKLLPPDSNKACYRKLHRSATKFLITLQPEDGIAFVMGPLTGIDFNKIYAAKKHEETYECV